MKDSPARLCDHGRGSGIGQALALELARRGARLAMSDVNGEAVAATAEECRVRAADVESFTFDVASREAVEQHAADVKERFGVVTWSSTTPGRAGEGRGRHADRGLRVDHGDQLRGLYGSKTSSRT